MSILFLIALFAIPLLYFSFFNDLFHAFSLQLLTRVINRSFLVYVLQGAILAFAMAWMDTYIYLEAKQTEMTDNFMAAGNSFISILLMGIFPAVIVLNIVSRIFKFIKKKEEKDKAKEEPNNLK